MASSGRRTSQSPRALNRPKKKTLADLLEDQLRDPTFRAAWEELKPKRRVIAALLRLRAEANLSQKALAEKAGWHPAFVSGLTAFPVEGEKLYMPNLATLETYAAAFRAMNAQSAQVTLKRLDEAFGHFFRRAKLGEKPGYPRFKSKNRFPGFGFKAHGDGFLFESGPNWKNGYLRISGIGWMQVRGEARTPGDVKACSIMRKVDGWYLSLVIACEPHREIASDAHEICGLDWGVESYMTVGRLICRCGSCE